MSNFKLMVEVCYASHLKPKDGEGSTSAFVEVSYHHQKRRTQAKLKDLNPVWNEKLDFVVSDPELLDEQHIEVTVLTQRKEGIPATHGRARIRGVHFKRKGSPGADDVISFPLERRGLFSQSNGEIFLKLYYYDEARESRHAAASSMKGKAFGVKEVSPASVISNNTLSSASKVIGDGYGAGHFSQQATVASQLGSTSAMAYAAHQESVAANDGFSVMATNPLLNSGRSSMYDLVSPIEYIFVHVVRAKNLAAKDVTMTSDPFVEVRIGNIKARTRIVHLNLNPEWNQFFAFDKSRHGASQLEITVWDKDTISMNDFLGYVSFETIDIPGRRPPDSPLAPQWYRLESRRNDQDTAKRVSGDIMLSVWIGTQADEAFPEAWQSDTGGHHLARSKVYMAPRLWYLRVQILEGQSIAPLRDTRPPEAFVKVELGFQSLKTRTASHRNKNLVWNDELILIASEPFDEDLRLTVFDHVASNREETLATVRIPLRMVQRRIYLKEVDPIWLDLEKERDKIEDKIVEKVRDTVDKLKHTPIIGKLHVRICLEGGYHVFDESVHYSSDMKPAERRLWKNPIGYLELGLLGGSNLKPLKVRDGHSSIDAYCVAKYGSKWVRTRTILSSPDPKWNEQYTWDVYDPCTVLTIGVFDNLHLGSVVVADSNTKSQGSTRDQVLGKVRVRLSSLNASKKYTLSYPLILLDKGGVKSMGRLELAVRFTCISRFNTMISYFLPLLPKMHYLKPYSARQQEILRITAMNMVVSHLAKSEPPIRQEVVQYMLDVDSTVWSLRKSKANWLRVVRVFSGLFDVSQWFHDVCLWKNPITTVLVHMLYLILVWYPELILPTVFLYMCLIGLWRWFFRPTILPQMDVDLSCANTVLTEDLDEEYDTIPTSKGHDIVKLRYDRVRILAGRIQTVVGDIASQLERFHALLDWRDPRATCIFTIMCFLVAVLLYVTPFQVIAVVVGVYVLRHPKFRNGVPGVLMNFFRRLPSLADRML